MKRNFATAAVGILLVAPVWAAPNPVTEARFVLAMQRGKAAYDRGDQASSEKEFRTALALRPDSLEARNNLGAAQYRAGRFAEAQQSFEKSGESTQSQLLARSAYQTGNSLFRQKKLAEAATAYKTALRWNEKDEDARFNLQVVLDQMKAEESKKQPDKKPGEDKSKPEDGKDGKDKSKPENGKEGKDKSKPESAQNKPGEDKSKSEAAQNKPGDGKDKSKPEAAQNKPGEDKSKPEAAQNKPGEDKSKPESAQGKPGEDKSKPEAAQNKPQAAPGQPTASAGRKGAPRDETERLLQYYQDKERQARLGPGPDPSQPRPSQESW